MVGFDSHAYCAHCRDKGKGTDPGVKNEDCQFCNILIQEQKSCLATSSYQKKKRTCNQNPIQEQSSSTLVDPALVSVLGVVKDRQDLNSEEASSTPGVNAKKRPSSEESSNVKDKKNDTTKYKDKAVKKHWTKNGLNI